MDSLLSRLSLSARLGWGPQRKPAFAVLHVEPLSPDPIDPQLLSTLLRHMIASPSAPTILISTKDRGLLRSLLLQPADRGLAVVLSSFDGLSDALRPLMQSALSRGVRVVWRGALSAPLPWRDRPASLWRLAQPDAHEWTDVMAYHRLDLSQTLLEGVEAVRTAAHCLDDEKAAAILDWPFEDACAHVPPGTSWPSDRGAVQRAMALSGGDTTLERIEQAITSDPVLTWRLLSYINSAGAGGSREIGSVRHAVMMLGLEKLRDWLGSELARSVDNLDVLPLRWRSMLRGRLMTGLLDAGTEQSLRSELHLCGLFSQLHLLLREPLDHLLHRLPLPARVQDAILRQRGPYAPYLAMCQALGDPATGSAAMVRRDPDLDLAAANAALLRMLASAHEAITPLHGLPA